MTDHPMDTDAVVALAGLVGRTGGSELEVGWLDDTWPHRWYATAKWRGARLDAEHRTDPAAAADLLARRILHGATCTHCGGRVNLDPDAGRWKGANCPWTRQGTVWQPGCGVTVDATGHPVPQ